MPEPRRCPSCGNDTFDRQVNGDVTCTACGFIVVDGDDSNVRGYH